ncbi:MAG: VOC family protein [Chloroflexi bacterium]|nr:VOC family protein [Chloroflexota bacterium]
MNLLGLRTLIYPVRDLDGAKRWYTAALGVEPYFDEPFYVGYSVAGYELGLNPGANLEDGPVTYWGVDDPQAAVDELVAKGATCTEQPHDVGDGILVATVRDPFGQLIGLIRNPHFKLPA